jgi:hypothetical protein
LFLKALNIRNQIACYRDTGNFSKTIEKSVARIKVVAREIAFKEISSRPPKVAAFKWCK